MPTVFFVDSGAMRGSSLLQAIRDAGFHTLPMSNADMALAVLNAIRADLLLVDLSSPATGGPRLIEEVRRNDQLRGMPIIAVGAAPDDEDLRRLKRRVGIGEVIPRGAFSRAELMAEIRKYLTRPAEHLHHDAALEWTN